MVEQGTIKGMDYTAPEPKTGTIFNVNTLRLVREKAVKSYKANSSSAVPKILQEVLEIDTYSTEIFGVMCNDTSNRVIGLHIISKGIINEAIVSTAEVCKVALLNNANNIILFHNHPSGNTAPSNADISVTRKIQDACKLLDIKVVDHVIMGIDGDSYSFAEHDKI